MPMRKAPSAMIEKSQHRVGLGGEADFCDLNRSGFISLAGVLQIAKFVAGLPQLVTNSAIGTLG